MGENNDYGVKNFVLMLTTSRLTERSRFVWYGQGQWSGHIMDWAGCNFHHGRLLVTNPKTGKGERAPVFDCAEDAVDWLIANYDNIPGEQAGHRSGEHECRKGCDEREASGWLYDSVILDELDRRAGRKPGGRDGRPRTVATLPDWLAEASRKGAVLRADLKRKEKEAKKR